MCRNFYFVMRLILEINQTVFAFWEMQVFSKYQTLQNSVNSPCRKMYILSFTSPLNYEIFFSKVQELLWISFWAICWKMLYQGGLTQGWSRVRSPPCVWVFYCVLAMTWLCLSPRLIRSQCALRWIDPWDDAGRQQLLNLSWADCVVGIQGKGLRKRIPLGRTDRSFTLDGECVWLVNRFLLPLFPL